MRLRGLWSHGGFGPCPIMTGADKTTGVIERKEEASCAFRICWSFVGSKPPSSSSCALDTHEFGGVGRRRNPLPRRPPRSNVGPRAATCCWVGKTSKTHPTHFGPSSFDGWTARAAGPLFRVSPPDTHCCGCCVCQQRERAGRRPMAMARSMQAPLVDSRPRTRPL